jgi:hypothetical protein
MTGAAAYARPRPHLAARGAVMAGHVREPL